ncbi:MAG: 2-dehydropantoate 2-reductase [Candidatus Promineifilaceae bacterium]
MKILIYGAGAVGGYLGAKLVQAGYDVTLVAREVTASLINESGLNITEAGKTFCVHPHACSSVTQAFLDKETYDLIILGMKAYDLAEAVDPLAAFCQTPVTFLTTQNGIDVEKPLVDHFGAEQVISGAFTMPVRRDTPNHLIVERTDRGLAIAPVAQGQSVTKWAALFREAAVSTETIKDYQAMKWSKAFLNIVGNATSAILNRAPGIIYNSDAMFELELRMLQETLAVMKAKGIPVIDLPGAPAKKLAIGIKYAPKFLLKPTLTRLVESGRGDKMPSFHIDLSSGKRKSEVIYHNGAIAKAGQELRIPVPVNLTLTNVLWALTQERIAWREFDGKPSRLLAELKKTESMQNS